MEAIQVIKRMRGACQSQLLLGNDGNLWVVKFQNNPEHVRVLANEIIGTRIAAALGLSVPSCAAINVSSRLIDSNPDLFITGPRNVKTQCASGLQFGSKYVGGLMPGRVLDYLPDAFLPDVPNLHEFSGMLAFDKWTGNTDARQAVYCRTSSRGPYRAVFIDQGHCFNGREWTYPDAPLLGVFRSTAAYASVSGSNTFEPWLQRIEEFSEETLCSIARAVPLEWYNNDRLAIEQLVEKLLVRRGLVRELIAQFAKSNRTPFSLWPKFGSEVPISDSLSEPWTVGYDSFARQQT